MTLTTTLSQPATSGWHTGVASVCAWLYGPVRTVEATGMQTYTCVMTEGNEVYVRIDDTSPGHTTIDIYSPDDEQAIEQ